MHRAKEETEGVQKGGEKSEKSENEKDRRRKDALSSARMGEKDMEEMIGGHTFRPWCLDGTEGGTQSTNSP